jgi:hypothetical protein
MSSLYRGLDIVSRLGVGIILIIKAEVDQNEMNKLLEKNYGLFIVDKYKVELYECEHLEGGGRGLRLEVGTFGNIVKSCIPDKSLMLEFEIPISSKLIDTINDIRRREKVVGFELSYSYSVIRIGFSSSVKSGEATVGKISSKGERLGFMTFSTEEISELMKKLHYAEFIRFEIPVPLIPEARLEALKRSVVELKNVEDNIVKGNYPEALRISRNIIMNYLLTKIIEKEGEKKRVLNEELRKNIIAIIPSEFKGIYEKILDGIENTLASNLEHIHKFIKEESGKLAIIPSREEAEYIYVMLILILRYISQLMIIWKE